MFRDVITSEQELRDLMGEANEGADQEGDVAA